MAQWLRSFTALAMDRDSVPSTQPREQAGVVACLSLSDTLIPAKMAASLRAQEEGWGGGGQGFQTPQTITMKRGEPRPVLHNPTGFTHGHGSLNAVPLRNETVTHNTTEKIFV